MCLQGRHAPSLEITKDPRRLNKGAQNVHLRGQLGVSEKEARR